MSRLDSFIRRVTAQRTVLDHVCGLVEALEGPVLELGLGNGRTYDHLRALFPGRDIYVFERTVAGKSVSGALSHCNGLRYSGNPASGAGAGSAGFSWTACSTIAEAF